MLATVALEIARARRMPRRSPLTRVTLALETADVVLMADDLSRLPFAVALSRASRRIIRQNLFVSLGVAAILIPATAFGWAGIGVAVLIHEGSTVVVVVNALRLLAYAENDK